MSPLSKSVTAKQVLGQKFDDGVIVRLQRTGSLRLTALPQVSDKVTAKRGSCRRVFIMGRYDGEHEVMTSDVIGL